MLDHFYISVFRYYKANLGKRSLKIAMLYINFLEISILLALAAFFKAFTAQMRLINMSETKFWTIVILAAFFVIFKNWMRYNGKRRHVLNAKQNGKKNSIYLLWLLPFGCILIAVILFQV